jgi:uncharacterized protein YjeT (DUF2065 family)
MLASHLNEYPQIWKRMFKHLTSLLPAFLH